MSLLGVLFLMLSERIVFLANGHQCQKNITFRQKISGKALVGHTFMTIQANDMEFCQALCFMHMEHGCISCTFDTQKLLCNLSNSDQTMHPEDVVDDPNAIFFNSENTCSCSSKNMSCSYSVILNDYHCYCKLGYGGPNCETDLNLIAIYPLNSRYQAKSLQSDAPDGVISNVTCSKDLSSPLGGSCEFKGFQSSYIEIPNYENGKLDLKGSMTFLAFINVEREGPLLQYNANTYSVHWWAVQDINLFVRMKERSMPAQNPPKTRSPIPKGHWNYVGMTYDRSTGVNSLWIEGERNASTSIGSMDMATHFEVRMGATNFDSRSLKGKITCLQLYKKPLDEFQIKQAKHHCDRYV